jgi:hypothetical protein
MSETLTDSITFYSRDDWNARDWRDWSDQGWDAHEVFIHHTDDEASGIDSFDEQVNRMKAYQNFHMDDRGWDDIGYHAVVFPPFKTSAGTEIPARIFQGRPRNHVPAAQAGHNSGTLAIAVVRGGDRRMFQNQRYAIEVYLNHLVDAGSPLRTLGGHRDVTSTSCPGNGIYSQDLPILQDATNLKAYR